MENSQLNMLKYVVHSAKFGGATGCLNAHAVAYPKVDWIEFSNKFISGMGLVREQYTTQISHYDDIGALCDNLKRINTIFLDFAKDMWTYISLEYFKQHVVAKEVGSSAMPHKVNPIDFENAEGNLGIANSFFEHFSSKLPISRMQRDLTDSTVLRNLGVPLGHTLLSFSSLLRGLGRISVNEQHLREELNNNWEVVSEAIQNILRREGVANPYEKLKALTRTGSRTNKDTIAKFLGESPDLSQLPADVKKELIAVTPENYIGVVPKAKLDLNLN